VHQNRILK